MCCKVPLKGPNLAEYLEPPEEKIVMGKIGGISEGPVVISIP